MKRREKVVAIVQAADMYDCKYICGKVEELKALGHTSLLLGWNRYNTPKYRCPGAAIYRFGLQTPLGTPRYYLLLPLFWAWVFFKLLSERPGSVISINTDIIPPCLLYSVVANARSVHEMRDFYHLHFWKRRWPIPHIIDVCNKWALTRSEATITSSDAVIREYCSRLGVDSKLLIEHLNLPTAAERQEICGQRGTRYERFTVCYIGTLQSSRGIKELIEAIKGIEGVSFIFGGIELAKGYVDECLDACGDCGSVTYVGFVSREKLIEIVTHSHILALLLDPRIPHHAGPLPTKVFESAYCHTPYLTTAGTSAADFAKKYEMGAVVQTNDITKIRDEIMAIRDDKDRWGRLVEGCRGAEAALEKKPQFSTVMRSIFGNDQFQASSSESTDAT